MEYNYIKALHLIFVITWFAGLFYIVRLFVYHAEAEKRPEAERGILQKQYKIMEFRLWYYIAWPSMVLALFFGIWHEWRPTAHPNPLFSFFDDDVSLSFRLALRCVAYWRLFRRHVSQR